MRVWGGYAPSPTFRLFLADARQAIFKAVNDDSNEHMQRALAAEERVYRELGQAWLTPWAPRFFGGFRRADWHVLLLEDVGRAAIPPWTPANVRQLMAGFAAFHQHSLGQHLPEWLSRRRHAHFGSMWRRLADQPGGLNSLADLAGERADEALAWTQAMLPRLQACAERLADVPPPYALLHFDTRSDNLRLQPGGRLRLFDWPFACVGPPAFDVVACVQSISCEGGPQPELALAQYTAHLALADEAVDASIAALAGYFALQAWQPPIPGLPRLRGVQRCQLKSSLGWCAARLGLPSPDWQAGLRA
jgi:hypothetical protein